MMNNRNLDIEIYAPWYFGNPDRPRITAAPSLAFPGRTILVKSTFAREIKRVVLLRCGTCTHAFNPDQRMVELAFRNPVDDDLLVDMPPNNNIVPPGPYHIFTIRGGKPEPDSNRASLGLPSFATDIYIVSEEPRQQP